MSGLTLDSPLKRDKFDLGGKQEVFYVKVKMIFDTEGSDVYQQKLSFISRGEKEKSSGTENDYK